MSLLKRASASSFTPKATAPTLEEKGDVTWDGDVGWSAFATGQRGDAPSNFLGLVTEGLLKNPVVRGAMQTITSSMSDAPLRAELPTAEQQDGFAPAPRNHRAQLLVDFPNPRDPGVALVERAVFHFMLAGNLYWLKKRDNARRVTGLVPIQPERIQSALTDDDDIPLAYKVLSPKNPGKFDLIRALDLIHIPDIDPLNAVFGKPRLLSASLDIRTDNEASDYTSEVLTNHGNPGMAVLVENVRSKGNLLERAEEKWQEKFGPGRGRGRIAFLPGAHALREIGFNLRDLEFPDLRRIGREGICAALGVDPMIIGLSSASRGGTLGGNEHTEARKKLWQQTIIPIMRRMEAFINLHLAPEFGNLQYKFDTGQIAALKEDRGQQFDRMKVMVESGSFAPQEIRVEGGFDPEIPDEFDTVVRSSSVQVVLKEEVFEEPPEPEPPVVPGTEETDEEETETEDE